MYSDQEIAAAVKANGIERVLYGDMKRDDVLIYSEGVKGCVYRHVKAVRQDRRSLVTVSFEEGDEITEDAADFWYRVRMSR